MSGILNGSEDNKYSLIVWGADWGSLEEMMDTQESQERHQQLRERKGKGKTEKLGNAEE